MKSRIYLLFLALLYPILGQSQIEYEICVPASWAGGGTGEISLNNLEATEIAPGGELIIDWPGITSIAPWAGFTVAGTGPFTLTFTSAIPASGSIGPFSFSFTNSGSYFAPPEAEFNGETVSAVSPACFVPPAYANFDCEISMATPCFHETQVDGSIGEIRIGQGTVYSWGAELDVYIPENKKSWAISMAVGHTMFTNLMGIDVMSINEYFATGIQETNCGCDSSITEPVWVSHPYPDHETDNPVYCFDYTHGVAVGFFQEEYGTGWLELLQDIPCFIPTFDFDSIIVGKNFEAQIIGKVYHDYNNMMYLQYVKCFDIIDFLENCNDPYGPEKLIAAIYNRGMNAGFIEEILVDDRPAALASSDLLTFIPGLGQQYAEQISRTTAVLDNNLGAVSSYGTTTYGVPWVGVHNHLNFYDELIAWSDVDFYLDQITEMYLGVGVDMTLVKPQVEATFNSVAGGAPLSFRYELGPVIDKIVQLLPGFEPMPGLGEIYGSSGGDDCSFPTARMEESMSICEGETANLYIYLTGEAPWTVTYEYEGISNTLTAIYDSPYALEVSDSGLYYLTAVTDLTGRIGEAFCDSVYISYSDSLNAELTTIGSGCSIDSILVHLTGSSPWSLELLTPSDTLITDSIISTPYFIPSPYTAGTYILENISNDACSVELNDTLLVDLSAGPDVTLPSDTSLCNGSELVLPFIFNGEAPYSAHLILDGIDSIFTVASDTLLLLSNTYSTIEFYTIADTNCVDTISSTVSIDWLLTEEINMPNDTAICQGQSIVLSATSASGSITWGGDVENDIPFTPASTNHYFAHLTDTNDCSNYDSVLVIINPNPVIEAGSDQLLCEGEETTLNASGAGAGGEYNWLPLIENGVPFTATESGTYTVTGIDTNGCHSSDSLTIILTASPVILFETNLTNGCVPLRVDFNYLGTGEDINWQFGDGSFDTGLAVTHVYNTPGLYPIDITAISSGGCTLTTSFSDYIHAYPNPIAGFTYLPNQVDMRNTEVNFNNTSTGATNYTWNFGDGSYSGLENPSHNFPEIGNVNYEIVLIASNNYDCTDTTSQQFTVHDILLYYVPNAFTPDGNAFNETFKPVFTSGFDPYDYHLSIFNRWGEIIFESYNATIGWDGSYAEGGLAPDGIYIWQIEFDLLSSDKQIIERGHFNLLK